MNIQTALDNVVSMYKQDTIDYKIIKQEDELCIVDVTNKLAPGLLLKIEIWSNKCCCVLEKTNVGFRSMKRFMDKLVEEL